MTPATYDVESGGVACEAPASEAAKSLSVAVTLNGGDYTPMIAFKYFPTHEVTLLEPACGPADGGTLVRISGRALSDAEQPRCRFGDGVETSVASAAPGGGLLCLAPAAATDAAASSVKVAVALNGVYYGSSTRPFSY